MIQHCHVNRNWWHLSYSSRDLAIDRLLLSHHLRILSHDHAWQKMITLKWLFSWWKLFIAIWNLHLIVLVVSYTLIWIKACLKVRLHTDVRKVVLILIEVLLILLLILIVLIILIIWFVLLLYKLLIKFLDFNLTIGNVISVVFPVKVFFNLLLAIYVEYLIFQALHVHCIITKCSKPTGSGLRELMCQLIPATLLLGNNL